MIKVNKNQAIHQSGALHHNVSFSFFRNFEKETVDSDEQHLF